MGLPEPAAVLASTRLKWEGTGEDKDKKIVSIEVSAAICHLRCEVGGRNVGAQKSCTLPNGMSCVCLCVFGDTVTYSGVFCRGVVDIVRCIFRNL